MRTLRKVKIEGFKSIESVDLPLNDLNVIIGANGSGKSNLIGAFRLLERVLSHNLQVYVASEPDRLLHHGRKKTPALALDLTFDKNAYGFKLKAAQDRLIFEYERFEDGNSFSYNRPFAQGQQESMLALLRDLLSDDGDPPNQFPLVSTLAVYHFQDTSESSPAKQTCDVSDNRALRPDAANLPAYLYWLQEKHPVQFRQIEEHIRLVAPFFDRFELAPSRLNGTKIKLEWRQKGSDAYFDAYSLSDGTLRFICLATLLLQPTPPNLVLLDEPELGLHPFAIRILAEIIEDAAKRVQVIMATQSVTLLNNFQPKDIIVAENDGQKTSFNRLDEEKLKTWLEEFSLGELWEKNVLGGRP
ncbi:MAG: AAA family ATPase [Rhodoferax sp.]|nr:AAA family ATPase [Rhodoferax sp.]